MELKKIFVSLPTVFLLLGILGSQFFLRDVDKRFPALNLNDEAKYLPSGTFLKGAALSFDEALADFLWIKTIGYFGDHFETDKDYRWLEHLLDVITTLDPAYEEVYELGGIILSTETHNIDSSNKILTKGIKNVPKTHKRYWYLPFYKAFNYMFYKGDIEKAAQYLEQAASMPGRPSYLPLLVGRLYANTKSPALAIPFLKEMAANAATPEQKKGLEKRINDLMIVEQTQILSKICKTFFNQNQYYPQNWNDLKEVGLVTAIPVDPYGNKYIVEDKCNIRSTSDVESMELHLKKKNIKKPNKPLVFLEENNE